MKKTLQVLLILLFMNFSTWAQNESNLADSVSTTELLEFSMEELLNIQINVGSSKSENIFNTASSVAVIDETMIKEYNFLTVQEAVSTIAGMSVYRTYLKRNLPTARGIVQDNYANKVLVLINGVPAWNAVTGEGNLERVDINDVKQIEVLKGPASVIYGTNAYSGAINIVLKDVKENESYVQGHTGVGLNNSYFVGANFAGSQNGLNIFASGNTSHLIGSRQRFIDEKGDSTLYSDELVNTNFNLKLNYKAHTFFVNSFDGYESHFGVVPAISSGAGNRHTLQGNLLSYNFNKTFAEKLDLTLGSYFDWQKRNLSRSKADDIRANIQGYRASLFLNTQYKVNENLSVEVGANYDNRFSREYKNYYPQTDDYFKAKWSSTVISGTDTTVYDTVLDGKNNMNDREQYEVSGYAQVKYQLKKFSALIGSRITNNELYGTNVSSRATFVYALNDKNSVKLIYGESYRSPALFEQYFVYTTVLANPDLKPELSKSIELAYLKSYKNLFFQALVYHGIYENQIFRQKGDYVFDNGFTVQNISIYDNGSTFTANGLELEVKYSNPKIVNCFLNMNYIDGDNGDEMDGNGHYNFKYVPQNAFTLGISRKIIKNLHVAALGHYMSETEGPYAVIPSQYTLDLNLGFDHVLNSMGVHHAFTIKNVLDEDMMLPEYVRRNSSAAYDLNEIPLGYPRYFQYSIKVDLD